MELNEIPFRSLQIFLPLSHNKKSRTRKSRWLNNEDSIERKSRWLNSEDNNERKSRWLNNEDNNERKSRWLNSEDNNDRKSISDSVYINQKIRLYIPFSDWYETKRNLVSFYINRKLSYAILFWLNLQESEVDFLSINVNKSSCSHKKKQMKQSVVIKNSRIFVLLPSVSASTLRKIPIILFHIYIVYIYTGCSSVIGPVLNFNNFF